MKGAKIWSNGNKIASAGREMGQLGDFSKRKPERDPSASEKNQSRAQITPHRLSIGHGQLVQRQNFQFETKTHS